MLEQPIETEEVEVAPNPGADEALRRLMPGYVPPPAQEAVATEGGEPPMPEAAPEGQPPLTQEAAPAPEGGEAPAAQAQPAADQALLEQIAQLQSQIQALQGSMPSEQDRKILKIANGGEGNFQRYLAAKNTNLDAFSPLQLLEMQFHEQYEGALRDKSSDERQEIFHGVMRGKYADFDPLDAENNFGLNPGQQFLMGQEADAYKSHRRKSDEEFMLSFDRPQTDGPPPFTDADHSSFRDMVADEYAKLMQVEAKDAQGNVYSISTSEIPGYEEGMKGYLEQGPGNYIAGKFLGADALKREIPNVKAAQQYAALELALPHLLSKVRAETEAKVREELGAQSKEALKSSITGALIGETPESREPPQFNSVDELLRSKLQAQRSRT